MESFRRFVSHTHKHTTFLPGYKRLLPVKCTCVDSKHLVKVHAATPLCHGSLMTLSRAMWGMASRLSNVHEYALKPTTKWSMSPLCYW